MRPEIVAAVLRRGNHRCAWCDCKLNTGLTCDRGTICKLNRSESDNTMVASCVGCASMFAAYWHYETAYSVAAAVRILGRETITESGPFVDYIIGCTDDLAGFDTALARVEAQRNAPLDLARKGQAV